MTGNEYKKLIGNIPSGYRCMMTNSFYGLSRPEKLLRSKMLYSTIQRQSLFGMTEAGLL